MLQSLFSGLAIGSVFAIIGIGFVVIHRVTTVINFAQGAFAVVGAYVMVSLTTFLAWPVALLVSVGAGAVMAAIIGFVVLAGSRNRGIPALMITLGSAIACEGIFILVWGGSPVSYPPVGRRALSVAGASIFPQQLLLIAALVLIFVLLQLFFTRSYLGKALTAAALNSRAAQLAGINLLAVGIVAFAVSGATSAAVGALLAPLVPITPASHVWLAVGGFTAAIIGRLHSPLGAALGGLFLGFLQALVANYGWAIYQDVVALLAMLIVLLIQATRARAIGRYA